MSLELRIVLAVLAVFRLAQLLALDDGPFDVFERLRRSGHAQWRKLVNCPYCLGVWLSAGVVPLIVWDHPVSDIVLLALGVAGGQALIESIAESAYGRKQ